MHKNSGGKESTQPTNQGGKASSRDDQQPEQRRRQSILNQISLALLVFVCAAPDSIALFEVNSYTPSLLFFSPPFVLQLYTPQSPHL